MIAMLAWLACSFCYLGWGSKWDPEDESCAAPSCHLMVLYSLYGGAVWPVAGKTHYLAQKYSSRFNGSSRIYYPIAARCEATQEATDVLARRTT